MEALGNPLQRTAEWFNDRIGCLTASQANDALARSKRDNKPLKGYFDLIDKLVAERVTGQPIGTATTVAMQWGIDHEDEARNRYEIETGEIVDLVGFIPHPDIPWFGASPDGLVGEDGLIEIKCPATTTHLRRIKEGVVPEEYKAQMQVQLLCTGRKWVDFVSYDPRVQGDFESLQFWTIRYQPTEDELEDTKRKCVEFLEDVEATLEELIH